MQGVMPCWKHPYGLCPCHTLTSITLAAGGRSFEQHISTGEATALPLTQVESQGTTFAVADPMELVGHAPLGVTNQARGTPPLLRLDAVGWALTSVASSISTSGSGASDADNSEKIRSKTPYVSPAAATVVERFVGIIGAGAPTQRSLF